MKYFIVANRAFNSRKEAEKFCMECDFDLSCIIETIPTKKRYFEMCTESSDGKILCYKYYTEAETQTEFFQECLQAYKNNEMSAKFVYFKEISEKEYLKHTA